MLDDKNTQPIDSLYAVISEDEEGNEGLVGGPIDPLVFGYEDTIDWIKKLLDHMIKSSHIPKGTRIKLVSFSNKETLEYFDD